MKISEFLQGRSVARQAVTRYINRHDEIFKLHVIKKAELHDAILRDQTVETALIKIL